MPVKPIEARDAALAAYRAKRDFMVTAEPASGTQPAASTKPIFVVQKHDATRLHYDFRLEHDGVLWSWAVPKGPSLDPHDKRLAVHVEDHPLEYAEFAGVIPPGQYGAGRVGIWDSGTWAPLGDAAAGLAKGEMKFELDGTRLHGRFVLVRLKPRLRERAENWLLIKEHDEHERAGVDAAAIEAVPVATKGQKKKRHPHPALLPQAGEAAGSQPLPEMQKPQLATLVADAPEGIGWLSEIKFDGYRLLAFKDGGAVRLVTRNGLDWTHRLRPLAAAVAKISPRTALLDGELVALQADGITSFPDLQAALSSERTETLVFYVFDLLHFEGRDLRSEPLHARKDALRRLPDWNGTIRFSDHVEGKAGPVRKQACAMGLEGIIAKRADSPYRAGRNADWVKLKCGGREEFVVIGWTPPAGRRNGIGALHVGFYDSQGRMHYAGGVGTGFDDGALAWWRPQLDGMRAPAPKPLLLSGEMPEKSIAWVRPQLVIEVRYAGWSGAGRLRHAVYLGLREDKAAAEIVRDVPDAAAVRTEMEPAKRSIVVVKAASRLTHPDRELWPGVTKQDLSDYWAKVAPIALPGIAHRPLALVRCPDGVAGQHFFQKHASKGMNAAIHEGAQDGAPYLAIADAEGLQAATQMAAIELHTWGATEADAAHADRLVFDLDPGEGVAWAETIRTAHDLKARLGRLGLAAFCRTSGGKGLHVVTPIARSADWTATRAWCRGFAEAWAAEEPTRFVAAVSKAIRPGHILIDWLRNGLGSTAVASFSPRARPGAIIATPVAWREVTPDLDPAAFTLATVPVRLVKLKRDPWKGFAKSAKPLPAEN